MNNEKNEQTVSMDWNFDDWMLAVGAASFAEIANVAAELGLTNPSARSVDIYNEKRIRDWAQLGLKDYDVALDMIKVLRAISLRNQKHLFYGGNLVLHARLFLKSKAGKAEWDSPDQQQTWEICKVTSQIARDFEDVDKADPRFLDLRMRVRPPLLWKLYGRADSQTEVIEKILKYPVTVIASPAGSGKTALAWEVAIEAFNEGLVTDFDWSTDKRQVIDAYGHLYMHEDDKLDLYEIIKNMARRFRWDDIAQQLLYKSLDDVIGLCADRLRKSRYLVVVDNLETLEDQNQVVNMLHSMMVPTGRLSSLSSRALITSRVDVATSSAARIDIGGIEEEGARQFILDLQKRWNLANHLNAPEALRLARAAAYNPLFIQIALRRYEAGTDLEEIEEHLATGANFTAFHLLFEPLVESLPPMAKALAVGAAWHTYKNHSETVDREQLRRYWVRFCTKNDMLPHEDAQEEVFSDLILMLLKRRILNVVPTNRLGLGMYTFHPLIRAYFLTKTHERP